MISIPEKLECRAEAGRVKSFMRPCSVCRPVIQQCSASARVCSLQSGAQPILKLLSEDYQDDEQGAPTVTIAKAAKPVIILLQRLWLMRSYI